MTTLINLRKVNYLQSAVVVAQFVEQSLPIPDVRSSNPVIAYHLCILSTDLKRRPYRKRCREWSIQKNTTMLKILRSTTQNMWAIKAQNFNLNFVCAFEACWLSTLNATRGGTSSAKLSIRISLYLVVPNQLVVISVAQFVVILPLGQQIKNFGKKFKGSGKNIKALAIFVGLFECFGTNFHCWKWHTLN